ncbi:S1C family serine protease [Cerasicoccus fimbriatus]|uniref:S1C family serine protease n=1 Tax=Cerasicoccus fimbriatus TaxID=3014554 RepID=UPI0022B47674|nr:trypsin-like peptidase domain-containing protein [Cerasicoccus sp. TK19100]
MKFILTCLLALAWLPAFGERATINLGEGNTVSGSVVYERPNSIFVDLGFTVLEIPRDNIIGIDLENVTQVAVANATTKQGLFQVLSERNSQSVGDWVDEYGEAVVLIRTQTGLGSGFVINPDGYLITNDHVIAGEHEISVTVFKDDNDSLSREQYSNVKIVASNPSADLALLKIDLADGEQLTAVPLGESNDIKQGQSVFAIGAPLGLDRTVSQGIVSNRNRPINGRVYIQTTTEISPGNSGGPLFNMNGEVIGVNNMKVVAMGAEGLAFAIPANVLKFFLENRDAFAFDPRNPNTGFRYNTPPTAAGN